MKVRRALLGLLLATGALACDRGGRPAAWPAFPADEAAARTLIAASTSARPTRVPALDAPGLVARVRASVRAGTAIAGEDAIGRWLRDRFSSARDVHVVLGVSHDSGLQIAWIRRLLGPVHQSQPIAIATEFFRADGRWAGAPPGRQKGDDAALARFIEDGDRRAFATLLEGQRAHDYTAWKYDYLPWVLDLALQVRASGGALLACDVPSRLGRRLAPLGEETRLRIRELHCALHLRDAALPRPRRVALIWGRDHLQADGLRRFLPSSADTWAVHLLGGRQSHSGLEAEVAPSLRVTDPILVPLGARERALLLPAPPLGLERDQRREDLDAPLEEAARGKVSVLSGVAGRASAGSGSWTVAPGEPTTFALRPGPHAVLWESGTSAVVLAIDMPATGAVEVDVGEDSISILQRRPR